MVELFQTNITMAQLAIQGHSTRGSEVIALLEILRGINKQEVVANRKNYVYFIDYRNVRHYG
jgi:hypothetical protein